MTADLMTADLRTPAITTRPIRAEDTAFLREVYAGTREAELGLVNWCDEQKAAFLASQFDAQHRYYQVVYPDGSFDVVLVDDRPVGRLYVGRAEDTIRIVDIALLSASRGAGIGTALVTALQRRAALQQDCVTIHVERNNPALAWYGRLGFEQVADRGVHLLLRWAPPGGSS